MEGRLLEGKGRRVSGANILREMKGGEGKVIRGRTVREEKEEALI